MCFKSSKHDEQPSDPPRVPETPAPSRAQSPADSQNTEYVTTIARNDPPVKQANNETSGQSSEPVRDVDARINELIDFYRGKSEEQIRHIVQSRLSKVYAQRAELQGRDPGRSADGFLVQLDQELKQLVSGERTRPGQARFGNSQQAYDDARRKAEGMSDEELQIRSVELACQAAAARALMHDASPLMEGDGGMGLKNLVERIHEADLNERAGL